MKSKKSSIFLYNKYNELVTYVDLNTEGKVSGYYNLHENTFTRYNSYQITERNKTYNEIKKAKIVFGEPCKLFQMFEGGDSYCKVIRKDSLKLDSPVVLSKIYTHNDNQFDGYTLNPSLVQDWLKKL